MTCEGVLSRSCSGIVRHYDVQAFDRLTGTWRPAKRALCAGCVQLADEYGMKPTPCKDGCGLREALAA